MIGGRQSSERMRGMGLALAALAVLVRLLFPSGFMLSPDRAALPTLVICTGQGAMTVAIDAQGHAHKVEAGDRGDPKSDGKTSHPCTFAVATAAFTAPLLIAAPIPAILVRAISAPLLTTQRPGLGLAAPPPPTTGPPSIV
jgi:hypothetical protein